MSNFKKIVSGIVAAATVAVSAGTAAQAGDWNRGPGHGYGGGNGPSHYAPAPRGNYGHPQYGHRDNRGGKIATGVAIGVGAVILGSILASEANRNNRYNGY